jgi:hypothetical protein
MEGRSVSSFIGSRLGQTSFGHDLEEIDLDSKLFSHEKITERILSLNNGRTLGGIAFLSSLSSDARSLTLISMVSPRHFL